MHGFRRIRPVHIPHLEQINQKSVSAPSRGGFFIEISVAMSAFFDIMYIQVRMITRFSILYAEKGIRL